MTRSALFAAVAAVCISTTVFAQAADQPAPQATPAVEAFREALSPLIGTWEMSPNGDESVESRIVYSWDPSGDILLARAQLKEDGGSWQSLGLTVLAPGDTADEIATHTFFTGQGVRVGTTNIGESERGNLLLSSSWATESAQIRLQIELVEDSAFTERTSARPNDDEAPWQQTREVRWERVMHTEPTLVAPNAADESDKTIVRTATVQATPAEVWRAWTTTEGMTEWWVEDADIELKIGGKFELYMLPDNAEFKGNRGSEGCTILAYAPERMLAATWNAPPTFPEQRQQHTRITVLFEPVEDGAQTRVTLIHSGWPKDGMAEQGGKWPQVYDYFDRAWTFVFDRLTMHFDD